MRNILYSKYDALKISRTSCDMEPAQSNGDLGFNGFPVSLNYFTALPDTSILSDSNLTVIFKSLLKRDSITKEKSLNDFVKLFDESNESLKDDLTILSWIQVYPKLALANSRSVRVLSHQIQGKFVQLGGKSFAKYLKSSIPIWLLGTYDTDRIVSSAAQKSLLASFQNDTQKIEKIWSIFSEPILNFIITSIQFENSESLSDKRYTKESDLILKYERILYGTILMLTKVVELIKSENQDFDPRIEQVLNHESFWNYMGSSIESETLNLSLFKSYLILLKTIFDTKSLKFVESVSDLNGLYKLVSKSFLKSVKIKSGPNNVIYSNIILQFWDTLIALTNFSTGPVKVKKNFWDYGGSKSLSRATDYLKLGSCSLNPVYFSLILHFMKLAHSLNIPFDFNDEATAKSILIKITCPQLNKLLDFDYLERAIEYAFSTYKLFPASDKSLISITATVLDAISKKPSNRKRNVVVEKLREVLSSNDTSNFSQTFEDSFVTALSNSQDVLELNGQKLESPLKDLVNTYFSVFDHEILQRFVENVIEVVEEDLSIKLPELAFHVVSSFVTNSLNVQNTKVADFIETSASFIESDFVDPPIELLLSVSKEKYLDKNAIAELINDTFTKLKVSEPSRISSFLLQVLEFVDFDAEADLYQDVLDFIHTLSENPDLNDQDTQLTYKFAKNLKILENLLRNLSSSESKNLQFIKSSGRVLDIKTLMEKDISGVMLAAWNNVHDSEVQAFLLRISENKEYYEKSLFSYISDHANVNTDFKNLVQFLGNDLPLHEISELLVSSIQQLSTIDLSIANPLETNIGLIPEVSATSVNDKLFVLGKFLFDAWELKANNNVIILSMIIAEYMDDTIFLRDFTPDLNHVQSLRAKILEKFITFIETSSTESLVRVFIDKNDYEDEVGEFMLKLSTFADSGEIAKFYAARVNYLIFSHLFDNMDNSLFEAIPINFNKLMSRPLDFAVMIKSSSKFLTKSARFERARNYAFAEILGVKGDSGILTEGVKWVTLATNFLSSEEPYEAVNSHRLLMVLKQIELFLDSAIAYDEDFLKFRVQLTRLFIGLLTSQSSPPSVLFELSSRLVEENIAQAQLSPIHINLRYFTLKLVLILQKSGNLGDIHEDLLDLILNKEIQAYDANIKNQAMESFLQLNERSYFSINWQRELISGKIADLYEVFSSSNFISIKRVCTHLVRTSILLDQQDFVVEYQLSKSKLSDDDTMKKALIPDLLLNNILSFEYLDPEDEKPEVIATYLWSWVLIFTFFEDVTYSIRSDYINQLKELDVIEKLLDYIFYSVEVADSKLLKNSTYSLEYIQDYDLKTGIFEESTRAEDEFLLLHLYYLSAKYLASSVQFWFKAIRDRQLKSRIDKFTVNYVSPILINKILQEVTKAKPDFEKRYDNMTLKVNSVSNEVKSIYVIDEQTMEMVIKLPREFPLGNVTVEGPLRLGVNEKQWKAWLMVAQSVISHTDGTIVDAIEIFNRNVNLHFSRFEDCAICYSILHQDLSLPTKVCPTCSNKFHAACLYKWFKSSGSSTCPLCRSAFNFKANRG